MPVEALDDHRDETVQNPADNTNDKHYRRKLAISKGLPCILDGITKARGHPEQLRRHQDDPGDSESQTGAGGDVKGDRRYRDVEYHVPGLGTEVARDFEPCGIDLGQAGGRRKGDRPD